MNKGKRAVTVTITENGKEVFNSTENIVFIVGENQGAMLAHCKTFDLLSFSIHVQSYFLKSIIPQLLEQCPPVITAEQLFNEIVSIAKRGAKMKGFIEVTNKDDGNKVLVSVSKIVCVDYDENNVYIVCYCELKRKRVERLSVFVQESYNEVKARIEKAVQE